MASKYLDMCPPVLASLKAGTPIIAIETGFFMQLPYPRNLEALQECEQAFYRRDCVPCCVGIVNGRLKAGLSKQDMDTLCRSGGSSVEALLNDLIRYKTEQTVEFFAQVYGKAPNPDAIRLLMGSQFGYFRQLLDEHMEEERMLACLRALLDFFNAGWRQLCGTLD